MMFSLSGHLGARVSALVDGQLSPAEEERAWSHVLACPSCRQQVEREGWTKRQLSSLSDPLTHLPGAPDALSTRLAGALAAADAWAHVDVIEQRSARRRTTALVGGGAVGAAVLGLLAVTGGELGLGDDRSPVRPAPATIRLDHSPTWVGSPTGAETNASAVWVRRSR